MATRPWTWIEQLIPALIALAAGAVSLKAGGSGAGLVLVVLGGALLGWTLVWTYRALAQLWEGRAPLESSALLRVTALQAQKDRLLRQLKALQLDCALGQLPQDEADERLAPLRAQVLDVFRELADAPGHRAEAGKKEHAEGGPVAQQIEQEVQRRLSQEKRRRP